MSNNDVFTSIIKDGFMSTGTPSSPVIVEIQRPYNRSEAFACIVVAIQMPFLRAWFVMLLLGGLGYPHFGYWRTFFGLILIRLVINTSDTVGWMRWTRARNHA